MRNKLKEPLCCCKRKTSSYHNTVTYKILICRESIRSLFLPTTQCTIPSSTWLPSKTTKRPGRISLRLKSNVFQSMCFAIGATVWMCLEVPFPTLNLFTPNKDINPWLEPPFDSASETSRTSCCTDSRKTHQPWKGLRPRPCWLPSSTSERSLA